MPYWVEQKQGSLVDEANKIYAENDTDKARFFAMYQLHIDVKGKHPFCQSFNSADEAYQEKIKFAGEDFLYHYTAMIKEKIIFAFAGTEGQCNWKARELSTKTERYEVQYEY